MVTAGALPGGFRRVTEFYKTLHKELLTSTERDALREPNTQLGRKQARCGSKCLRQASAPGPRMTLILRRVAAKVFRS